MWVKNHPRVVFGVVLLSLVLAAACSKKPTEPIPEEFIVAQTTKVLSDTLVDAMISLSPDSSIMTFEDDAEGISELEVGQVVVSKVDRGFIRKITDIETSGGQTVVTTVQADLTEVLQKGTLELTRKLTVADLSSLIPYQPGIRLKPVSRQEGGITVEMSNVVICDLDGNLNTTADQVTMNGSLNIDPEFEFRISIDDFQLKELVFKETITEEIQATVSTGFSIEAHESTEIPGARLDFSPIVVWAGFVPVVISPSITFRVGFDGQVTAEVTTGITQTASVTAGLSYAGGAWDPITDCTTSFEYSPPVLSTGCEAKGYAGPKLNLLLYGVIGPYVSAGGFLKLEADLWADPWWELYGGFEAGAGVRFTVLDRDIVDYEIPDLISYQILIAQATSSATGTISGTVRDALTQLALQGAKVEVLKGLTVIASGYTDASGAYTIEVPVGEGYDVEISKMGYLTELYHDITIDVASAFNLETVLQIDEGHSGAGNASGTIVNALDGSGVGGLTVRIRKGLNNTTGTVVATTTTSTTAPKGFYSFSGLQAGNYTAEASGTNYNTTHFTIICIGGLTTPDQDATITPWLEPGETRIILTWGESPRDLDSHLFGPLPDATQFHLYYPYAETNLGSPWPEYVKLDLDDVTSYGPETTTIYNQVSGVYTFLVHDYTNRSQTYSYALSNSNAQVRVYRGSNLVATFYVPTNEEGTLWTVFEMSGDDIIPRNTMSYSSAPGSSPAAAKRYSK
jgi:hypothetical protein